LIPVQK